MLKNLIAIAMAAGVSLSASASYLQYNLNNVTFDDGKHLSGWFVQDTNTDGIAFYDITGGWNTYVPGDDSGVTNAYRTVHAGPTSFDAWTRNNGVDESGLHLTFAASGTPGQFVIEGYETMVALWPESWPPGRHAIVGGNVTVGEVANAGLLQLLETGTSGFDEVAPSSVPEPGTLALLAAGVGLMARLRARRRAQG